jgi:hypothetical protein
VKELEADIGVLETEKAPLEAEVNRLKRRSLPLPRIWRAFERI